MNNSDLIVPAIITAALIVGTLGIGLGWMNAFSLGKIMVYSRVFLLASVIVFGCSGLILLASKPSLFTYGCGVLVLAIIGGIIWLYSALKRYPPK